MWSYHSVIEKKIAFMKSGWNLLYGIYYVAYIQGHTVHWYKSATSSSNTATVITIITGAQEIAEVVSYHGFTLILEVSWIVLIYIR